jgi:hypothetical protein
MYLKDVEVQHDWFADHSILIARFHPLGNPPLLPLWKHPAAIDWSMLTQAEVAAQFEIPAPDADPTNQYANLMRQAEQAVDKALRVKGKGPLPNNMRGRGQQLEVVRVQAHSAPVKKPREGELQPSFHGLNQQHCRWVRHYRRLVNYARLVQACKDTLTAHDHKSKLWQSIVAATGFAPSFPQWISEQTGVILTHTMPPPDHSVATRLCQAFHQLLTSFEKTLNAQRTTAAKQRRKDDPAVIYLSRLEG